MHRDRFIALFTVCASECNSWPARFTAALVFLIQLLGGKGKGKVLGNREQGIDD